MIKCMNIADLSEYTLLTGLPHRLMSYKTLVQSADCMASLQNQAKFLETRGHETKSK